VAKDNASTLGAEVEFIQSDWLDNITGKYDIIVSNPPYIEPDDEHLKSLSFEPQAALTDFCDGMSAIKKIITGSLLHLRKYLIIEHGYNQGKATADLMLSNGFKDVRTIRDYANLDRVTLGKLSLRA
jgi:release factor glutamine methyltransferase